MITGIESIIAKSFQDARRAAEGRERPLHRRVALDAFEKLARLYQETGLMVPGDFEVAPTREGTRPNGSPPEKSCSGTSMAFAFARMNCDPKPRSHGCTETYRRWPGRNGERDT